MESWTKDFIVAGRYLLTKLYQLRYDAHDLRQGIQQLELTMTEGKPKYLILISQLAVAYDVVVAVIGRICALENE